MDLLLIHNPAAGVRDHTEFELKTSFEEFGHRVRYLSTEKENWKEALTEAADAIVAVGGDGTIRRLLIALAEKGLTRVPVAILAKGTANNVASSVGACAGSAHELANKIRRACRSKVALGIVRRHGEVTGRFVESAGLGVFAKLLRKAANKDIEEVDEGRTLFRDAVEKAEPRPIPIWADDEEVSGDYLLVEAMNIASIGPKVVLAPTADHTDDWLDLVLVRPEDRKRLLEYIDGLAEGRIPPPPIAARRVRRVRVHWQTEAGHLDDTLWPTHHNQAGAVLTEFTVEIETRIPLLVSGV